MSRIAAIQGAALAEAWNRAVPVGSACIRVDDLGKQHETKTRSKAWTLGDGSPVVKVEGIAGGYRLERIIPLAAEFGGVSPANRQDQAGGEEVLRPDARRSPANRQDQAGGT
jgi:hypothetical protein